MALAKSQLYSYFQADRPYDPSDSPDYIRFRQHMFDFKTGMLNGGAWTTWGSHDGGGTFGNGDTTDRWASPTGIVRTGSNDPWYVFQGPVSMGSPQLLLGSDYISGVAQLHRWDFIFSPGGNFGAGAGGTDGTATAYPTAPDQIVLGTNDVPIMTDIGTNGSAYGTFVCEGADGSLMLWQRAGQQTNLFMAFISPNNAPVELDNGLAWIYSQENPSTANRFNPSTGVCQQADLFSAAKAYGMVSGTLRSMYMGSRGYNGSGLASALSVRANKKYLVTPIDLYAVDAAVQGYYGSLPDMYYGPANNFRALLGDSVGGAANWIVLDSLVIPWDPTAARPNDTVF